MFLPEHDYGVLKASIEEAIASTGYQVVQSQVCVYAGLAHIIVTYMCMTLCGCLSAIQRIASVYGGFAALNML